MLPPKLPPIFCGGLLAGSLSFPGKAPGRRWTRRRRNSFHTRNGCLAVSEVFPSCMARESARQEGALTGPPPGQKTALAEVAGAGGASYAGKKSARKDIPTGRNEGAEVLALQSLDVFAGQMPFTAQQAGTNGMGAGPCVLDSSLQGSPAYAKQSRSLSP